MSWPLDNRIVQAGISSVVDRSDREGDVGELLATFVDPGITIRLNNHNNQIIFGRRGTGKTHVLKVLEHEARETGSRLPIYIDMRTLGSSELWEDASRPAHVRVSNLLRDVLGPIQNALLDYATRPDVEPPGPVLESLNILADAITRSVVVADKVISERAASSDERSDTGLEVDVLPTPRIRLTDRGQQARQQTIKIIREGKPLERILFAQIGDALANVVTDAGLDHLVVLLDEWTAIPVDLQPLLAEFIKRTFLPRPNITAKIAAIEYRSCFGVPLDRHNTLGFELTADVSAALELDDFFIFDRDERAALDTFAEMLYRHVAVECDRYWLSTGTGKAHLSRRDVRQHAERKGSEPGFYLQEEFSIRDRTAFVGAFFDKDETFAELARAGEGIARDFISLFKAACFDARRRQRVRVDVGGVREVAREWYAREKITGLNEQEAAVLERIVGEVVGRHKARSFLFEKGFERSEVIMALIDLRVIHLVKRGFIPDGEPSRQYNVYTLDYGTYVDALGTDRAPRGDFTSEHGGSGAMVVPFHDDRGIKRIVLPPELFEEEGGEIGAE
jgi:hypothetical protein